MLEKIKLNMLFLDPNNYRLRSKKNFKEIESDMTNPTIQSRTLRWITGENNIEVNDLIRSFMENGFLKVDAILVKKLDDKSYLVIEGNRRIAALKVLESEYIKGISLGNLANSIFKEGIEVDVVADISNDSHYLVLMGLKHVSGNKKWDLYNQASLINKLLEQYESRELADMLAISTQRVNQLNKAFLYMQSYIYFYNEYIAIDSFSPFDNFQIFIELLSKMNIITWLGVDVTQNKIPINENSSNFFKWISPEYEVDEDSGVVLDDQKPLDPIIDNHKILRDLNKVIEDTEIIEIMVAERNLEVAMLESGAYAKNELKSIITIVKKSLEKITYSHFSSLDSSSFQQINNDIDEIKEILESVDFNIDKIKKKLGLEDE